LSFPDAIIHVRRTWTCGRVGLPKSKASKGPVPLHPLLSEFMFRWNQKTRYSQPADRVFPSFRLNGKQPRVANMLVEDYLRPAAVKAGVLASRRDDKGRLVDDDSRFGFHNLRHSLASFLSALRLIPRPCKPYFATAMSNWHFSFIPMPSAMIGWLQQGQCWLRFSGHAASKADWERTEKPGRLS